MNLKQLFRKYFLITVGALFVFLALANFTFNLIFKSQDIRPALRSPLFFARLIDDLGPDRIKNLHHIEALNQDGMQLLFLLVDENGHALTGDTSILPTNWDQLPLPKGALEFSSFGPLYDQKTPPPIFPFRDMAKGHHGGTGLVGGTSGPTTIGSSGPAPRDQIIRLPGTPGQFLLVHFKGEERHKPQPQFYLLSFALLVFSILLGVGVAMIFIFRSLGHKIVLADSVIEELQKGNLKARFPIKKRDEFGAAMIRFNQMADEIELLVERQINTERSRMKLLQELAHDLRTPVTSLKNLLETLQTRENTLTPQVKTELISLSVKEIDYFGRLIEDLLILAQVSEPRYHSKNETVDLAAIFLDEAESAVAQFVSGGKPITFTQDVSIDSLSTQGDSLLLRRMFRNVMQNACSFARASVHVSLILPDPGHATFIIEDDGPGFSEEGIKSFGVRRVTRILGSDQNSRLSVGLGSVIVKTVVELNRGTVLVENRLNPSGSVAGARVILRLNLLT